MGETLFSLYNIQKYITMKWCIDNDLTNGYMRKLLKESVTNGNFSNLLMDTIIKSPNTDIQITFRSDNCEYIENIVDTLVGLCHMNSFIFDIAIDDDDSLYRSDRIKNNLPRNTDNWYFTISKLTFSKDNGTSYHIHVSKETKNCHLLFIYDKHIV